jgi:hypothetical protein
VFFMRWRQLPKEQMTFIERYAHASKPVFGFRTASHSFKYPAGHELESWNSYAADFFGAPPGWGVDGHRHYGHQCSTDVSILPAAAGSPLLKGVAPSFHVRSWLYNVLPKWPPQDAVPLLMGKAVDANTPNVPENPVAWTWKNKWGGRAFYTSLGHPEDFQVESFQRLVVNALHWAAGLPLPDKWDGKIDYHVAYHGLRPAQPAPAKPQP